MSKTKGQLIAIYGPMFSGKTNYLIEQFGEGEASVVFKPDLDERYTKRPVVVSHDRREIPAVLVNHKRPLEMTNLLGEYERVLIDEVNFFSLELVPFVQGLVTHGKQVYVAGLALDSEQQLFGPMTELLKIADKVVKLTAKCDGDQGKCREKATHSYRKIPKQVQIRVAGVDEYGAACKKHYGQLHHKPQKKQ